MAEKHADPLLVAKNKWLIGHPESGLPDNMVLGLCGENRIVLIYITIFCLQKCTAETTFANGCRIGVAIKPINSV